MRTVVTDLGDLVFGSAILFAILILVFEWAERRRESRAEKSLLDAIDQEYKLLRRMGQL